MSDKLGLLLPIPKYAIGYAIFLTLWSLSAIYDKAHFDSKFRGMLGILILFIIYFYLNWALQRLYAESSITKGAIILSGVLVAFIGCLISTTVMWFGNAQLNMPNAISNSIRAIIIHGLLGLIMSFIIAAKISRHSNG
ncbi:MAG: hypothetical protein ACHQIM_22695 [Sphingobacteriales bacterium]